MQDLIERLEKLSGPDRELDNAIWASLGQPLPDDPVDCPPHYSASIDAALTLVPEGLSWWIDGPTVAAPAEAGIYEADDDGGSWFGATPAIALCIAALRVRASQKGSQKS